MATRPDESEIDTEPDKYRIYPPIGNMDLNKLQTVLKSEDGSF